MVIDILPKKVNAVVVKNIILHKFCIRIKLQISIEKKIDLRLS